MRREAARLFLEVKSVRVERLHDISPRDAQSEGIKFRPFNGNFTNFEAWLIKDFAVAWNSLNAKRGYSWDTNPWVWVYEFMRRER